MPEAGIRGHHLDYLLQIDRAHMTCEKAGLRRDRWKDRKNVKIYKFQTKIFKEDE